jgi:hypothetical protein
MKVAILFFGQPRFIENAQVLHTYKNLIKRYDADVFCHVWWEESGIYETATCSTLNGCRIHKNAIDIIKENYRPKVIDVEQSRKFFMPIQVKQFLDAKFTNRFEHWNERNYGCVLSQLYSIQSVSRLFEQYEKENNQKYDWIFLVRYDGYIHALPRLDHPKLPQDKFYISDHHPNFPDLVFCYSRRFCDWSSNVFDDISSVYHTIWEPSAEAFKSGSFYKRFTAHDIMPTHMKCDIIRN